MPAPQSGLPKILIASADQTLSTSRKQILEKHGWLVATTRNKQHGLALLYSERFHILLICASVSGRTRREYAVLFRAQNPGGKVIVNENAEDPTFPHDALLSSPVTPQQLVDTVRGLLAAMGTNE